MCCHTFVISKNFKKENKIFIEIFLLVRRKDPSFQHTGLQSYKLLPYKCNGVTQRPGKTGRLCGHGDGEPRHSSASGPRNPAASSSPLRPVHVFLASGGGAQSDPNPQNFQEAVGECIKFKLNGKNLRRRELSSSQQALKEEIKGMHRLQIFKSVPKHWPYPGCLDVVAKTLDECY